MCLGGTNTIAILISIPKSQLSSQTPKEWFLIINLQIDIWNNKKKKKKKSYKEVKICKSLFLNILWLFFSEAIIDSSSSYINVKISPILLLYNLNVLHLHASFYYQLSEYDAHGTWLSVGLAKNYSLGPGTWPFPIWVNNNIPFCKCKNCFCFSLGKRIQDLKNSMGISILHIKCFDWFTTHTT